MAAVRYPLRALCWLTLGIWSKGLPRVVCSLCSENVMTGEVSRQPKSATQCKAFDVAGSLHRKRSQSNLAYREHDHIHGRQGPERSEDIGRKLRGRATNSQSIPL